MNNSLLGIGLLVILLMLAIPPWQVDVFDETGYEYAAATASVAGFESEFGTSRSDAPAKEEYTETGREYHLIPAAPQEGDERESTKVVSGVRMDTARLLLQIVLASLFFGVLAFLVGSGKAASHDG